MKDTKNNNQMKVLYLMLYFRLMGTIKDQKLKNSLNYY